MNQELLTQIIKAALQVDGSATTKESCFEIGKAYLIRTVTFAWTGRIVAITDHEIKLADACCVFYTGRYSEAAKGVWDSSSELESVPDGAIIGRGAISDAIPLSYELPRKTK